MSMEGVHDVQLVEGSVNGDKFEEFVSETLKLIYCTQYMA